MGFRRHREGIQYYEQSIAQDPTFALPYFGIGYSSPCAPLAGRRSLSAKGGKLPEERLPGSMISPIWDGSLGRRSSSGRWDFKRTPVLQQAMASNHPLPRRKDSGTLHRRRRFSKVMAYPQYPYPQPLPIIIIPKASFHYLSRDYPKALEHGGGVEGGSEFWFCH